MKAFISSLFPRKFSLSTVCLNIFYQSLFILFSYHSTSTSHYTHFSKKKKGFLPYLSFAIFASANAPQTPALSPNPG